MKWSYDLTSAEPIIMDLPAYDATTIKVGAMVMIGATAFASGADASRAVINAYSTTAASSHAINTVGIAMETKTTADLPSIATACNTTAAICWMKCTVNPFAVYRAQYNTAQQIAITSCSATHMVATLGTGNSSADGYMFYMGASAGPNYGHLGFIANSATSTSISIDTALTTTATTADTIMLIAPPSCTTCPPLSTDSTMIGMITTGTASLGILKRLAIIDTFVDADRGFMRMNISGPYVPTTSNYYMSIQFVKNHPATRGDGFLKGPKKTAQFYNDLVIRNHVWGNTAS